MPNPDCMVSFLDCNESQCDPTMFCEGSMVPDAASTVAASVKSLEAVVQSMDGQHMHASTVDVVS